MAANYWNSTQRRFWHFTRDQLADKREDLEEQERSFQEQYPLPDRRLVYIWFRDQLHRLSRRLQTRQQAIATTMLYIQRYLLTVSMYNTNPYVLLSTAFYLASKTEEAPHHIRLVFGEARTIWSEYIVGDVSKLGEMEFSLISEMRSQLIVWHPYRTLLDLKENSGLSLSSDEIALAWSIINDSYMTDLPLLCAPHEIAVMAIFLAIVFQPNRASLGLHSLPPQQAAALQTPTGQQSQFQSLGGRPGVSSGFQTALTPTSNPSVVPNTSNGSTLQVSSNQNKVVNTTISSERMQKVVKFLAESEVDLVSVIEATQEIISLYELWEQYNEKNIREAIAKYVHGRGLDK